jgi:diguanylate cyclase (GGDEF)-like protein/PAS domain S-box-containing protein
MPALRRLPPLPAAVPLLAAVPLAAAVAGALPVRLAAGLAAGVAGAVYSTLMLALALRVHRRAGGGFGACRGAAFLAAGVLLGTVGAAAAGLVRPGAAGTVAIAGLLPVAVAYLLGLLLLPGAAPTPGARLRRLLDGTGLGITVLYSAWLFGLGREGGSTTLRFVVALVAAIAVSVAVVTGLRAVRHRPAALGCAAGSALGVLGLAGQALAIGDPAGDAWLPWTALLLVAGPALVWLGARLSERVATAPPEVGAGGRHVETRGTFAAYPILGVPAVVAMAATVYALVTGGVFDTTAIALAVAAFAVLALRETLGALDVARYARELSRREARFQALVAGSGDVIMVLDSDLVVRWQSPAAARHFGLSDQDVKGRSWLSLLHPDDVATAAAKLALVLRRPRPNPDDPEDTLSRPVRLQARLRDGHGHWRDTETFVSDQRGAPPVAALVLHVTDIGERAEMERAVHRLTGTDPLTGLANRSRLLRAIADLLAGPEERTGAVVLLDLDGLSAVNSARGQEAGDLALIEVSRRLRESAGEDDLVARIDGDEFAIATRGTAMQAYALATRLLAALAEPISTPAGPIRLRASAGLTDLAATSVDDVLRRADLALRRARQLGHRRVEWYDRDLETALIRRTTLEQGLPGSVRRGELDLAYQPVVNLIDGRPVGVEALLRWRHPTLGTVSAADAIKVAEELDVVAEIGEWVLHQAARQLSGWLRDGHDLWLAVNVSARQLADHTFPGTVATVLDLHDIPAHALVLEVGEAGLGADARDLAPQLAAIRALGARTALDDFGTGLSSLAHLRRLPLDLVKIDQLFFAEPAGRGGPAVPLIEVMVGLGRRLGIEVVAEGLAEPEHVELVRAAGCRFGQGYHIARPAPAEHLEAYLESHRSPTI